MSSTRESLIRKIEAFLAETGMSERQFGMAVSNNHKFMKRLRSGAGITLTVIEKAERVMAERRAAGIPPEAA